MSDPPAANPYTTPEVTLAASAMMFTLSNVPVVRVPMLVYLAGLIYVGVCAIGVSIGAFRMRGALQRRSTFTDLLPPLRFAAISAGLLTLGLIVLPFAIGFAGAAAAW